MARKTDAGDRVEKEEKTALGRLACPAPPDPRLDRPEGRHTGSGADAAAPDRPPQPVPACITPRAAAGQSGRRGDEALRFLHHDPVVDMAAAARPLQPRLPLGQL